MASIATEILPFEEKPLFVPDLAEIKASKLIILYLLVYFVQIVSD
jgi:hypothetical protein